MSETVPQARTIRSMSSSAFLSSRVTNVIDWGDSSSEETVLYPSASDVKIKHSWESKGNYIIKAKAVDVYGAQSNYSSFEINVPKNKLYYFKINLICLLFEQLLNANLILERLLNL